MKKNLILHIGWPKTGTTALQALCVENIELLRRHGLDYYTSRYYAHCISSVSREVAKGAVSEASQERFDDFLAKSPATTILLSSEGLARTDLGALTRFINPARWQKITVIAYLRSQEAYLEGWFKQSVKWGAKHSLEQYLAMQAPWAQADYAASLLPWQEWCEQLPCGELRVRLFERQSLFGGNIARDFFAALGWDDLQLEAKEVNASPSRALIQLYLKLPPIERLQQINRVMVASEHPGATGSGDIFTPHIRAQIDTRYRASNELVRKRYFPERSELFTPNTSSKNEPANGLEELLISVIEELRGVAVSQAAQAALSSPHNKV